LWTYKDRAFELWDNRLIPSFILETYIAPLQDTTTQRRFWGTSLGDGALTSGAGARAPAAPALATALL